MDRARNWPESLSRLPDSFSTKTGVVSVRSLFGLGKGCIIHDSGNANFKCFLNWGTGNQNILHGPLKTYHCRKHWRSVLRLPTDRDGRCPRIQMTAFAFIAAFSIDRAEWKKEIGVWAQPLRGKGYDSAPSSSLPFQSSSIRRGLHSHKMQRKKQETLSLILFMSSRLPPATVKP